MAAITALTAQKKNRNRVNVHLDGEFAFGLAAITAAWLRVGQTLTEAEIAELKRKDAVESGQQGAIRLISSRPRSVSEIRQYLGDKGYEAEAVELIVSKLISLELLDDAAFANYWVDQREQFRPRSRIALRQELQQKGISRETAEMALEAVDETASARRLAAKQSGRWARLPWAEFRVKLGQYLQRQGFGYDIINEITNEMWQSLGDEPGDI